MKGRKGRRGLHSVWYFLISWREVKELGFCFLLGAGFYLSLNSFLGHLAAAVGGLGLALVGAGPATALLANRRGCTGVSKTVSEVTIGIKAGLGAGNTLGAGGLSCRSWTRSANSSISCKGACSYSAFNWETTLSSGGAAPSGKEGLSCVQSAVESASAAVEGTALTGSWFLACQCRDFFPAPGATCGKRAGGSPPGPFLALFLVHAMSITIKFNNSYYTIHKELDIKNVQNRANSTIERKYTY